MARRRAHDDARGCRGRARVGRAATRSAGPPGPRGRRAAHAAARRVRDRRLGGGRASIAARVGARVADAGRRIVATTGCDGHRARRRATGTAPTRRLADRTLGGARCRRPPTACPRTPPPAGHPRV